MAKVASFDLGLVVRRRAATSHHLRWWQLTYPFGTHICTVEVDRETGQIDLLRYVAVDDVGNVINPMIADGQVHTGGDGALTMLAEGSMNTKLVDGGPTCTRRSLASSYIARQTPSCSTRPFECSGRRHRSSTSRYSRCFRPLGTSPGGGSAAAACGAGAPGR